MLALITPGYSAKQEEQTPSSITGRYPRIYFVDIQWCIRKVTNMSMMANSLSVSLLRNKKEKKKSSTNCLTCKFPQYQESTSNPLLLVRQFGSQNTYVLSYAYVLLLLIAMLINIFPGDSGFR